MELNLTCMCLFIKEYHIITPLIIKCVAILTEIYKSKKRTGFFRSIYIYLGFITYIFWWFNYFWVCFIWDVYSRIYVSGIMHTSNFTKCFTQFFCVGGGAGWELRVGTTNFLLENCFGIIAHAILSKNTLSIFSLNWNIING